MQQADSGEEPPKDQNKGVFLILVLHGVGILLPWNVFITARSYFVDYKMSKNYTGQESNYATYFLQSVGFASQIPNIIFNWINVFISIPGSITPRILLAVCFEMILFIINIAIAASDTSGFIDAFFWTTMVIIVLLNMANGIYQSTIFGIAAKLPSNYSGAVILGYNVSGTFVSILDLLTITISPSIQTAAVYYFVTAFFILLMCLATYSILFEIKFFAYYEHKSKQPGRTQPEEPKTKIPYWRIFKTAFSQLFNVFFVFFVTLSIFPAMQASITKSDSHFIVPEKYYPHIMCFLTFNTTAMLGCFLSQWINWPSPKMLLVPVLLRALFIPFFFFCNYQPTNKVRKVPVLIPNDWLYWVAGILFGFTSGYLSTKAIVYTTGNAEAAYVSVYGMLGSAVLVTGIFSGVIFSMMFPTLAGL